MNERQLSIMSPLIAEETNIPASCWFSEKMGENFQPLPPSDFPDNATTIDVAYVRI